MQQTIPKKPGDLRPEIESLIRKAGHFIREEFLGFSTSRIRLKGENTNNLVSYVDLRSEEILKEGCRQLLPKSGFINEEGGTEAGSDGFTWIIDPVDGTTNFVHGLPHFAISLALQLDGKTVLGFVYDPNRDEMFSAEAGKGAFLNGKAIHVSETSALRESLLCTGFPYHEYEWLDDFVDLVNSFQRNSHGIRRYGSAALDLSYVATGRFDAFFELDLNSWDVAAGILIVEEAGGKVSGFDGQLHKLDGRQLVSSNGKIHSDIIDLIREKDFSLPEREWKVRSSN
jgi:myo-inositol-1(or 4)-monophosphatase